MAWPHNLAVPTVIPRVTGVSRRRAWRASLRSDAAGRVHASSHDSPLSARLSLAPQPAHGADARAVRTPHARWCEQQHRDDDESTAEPGCR